MTNPSFANLQVCPCSSGLGYDKCCQPYHLGEAAATPEVLMRTRYSAFALKLPEYLLQTWHPSTRPSELTLHDSPNWKALNIFSFSQEGDLGKVHFRAFYQGHHDWYFLEEYSDFIWEAGRWYYVSGTTEEGQLKLGRNDQCPCGSGKKVKVCCRLLRV